jgi:pyruvate carboxylase subunit B
MSDQVKMTTMNYDKDRPKAENPIKIMDLSLRDGHQSLFATRGRTEDMIPVAEKMDQVGFWAVETWGGATFDTMHRFLNEDPWERIRTLKRYFKKTPFPCCCAPRTWWATATMPTMWPMPSWTAPVKTAWTSSAPSTP